MPAAHTTLPVHLEAAISNVGITSYVNRPILPNCDPLTAAMKAYESVPQSDRSSSQEHWQDREKLLTLRNGRTLAYADKGNPDSSTIVLRFHNAFDVGCFTMAGTSPVLTAKGVHVVAPTLPGWGRTSPPLKSTSFPVCVLEDVVALLHHLHPDTASLRLYVAGYGYGGIAAQILYHAPFETFPMGRQIVAMFLSTPASPKVYINGSSSGKPPAVGTPPEMVSLSSPLTRWSVELVLRYNLRNLKSAERWIEEASVARLDNGQRKALARWLEERGSDTSQHVRDVAQRTTHSVSETYAGLRAFSTVMQWRWGNFDPAGLDKEQAARPILLASIRGRRDTQFLVEQYKNVRALYYADNWELGIWKTEEIWETFMSMA